MEIDLELLINGDFAAGDGRPVTLTQVGALPTGADAWSVWNGAFDGTTIVETLPKGPGQTGRMLRVRTSDAACGVMQILGGGGNVPEQVTSTVMVYVVRGRVALGTGNGAATEPDSQSTSTGEWEVLQALNGTTPATTLVVLSTVADTEFLLSDAACRQRPASSTTEAAPVSVTVKTPVMARLPFGTPSPLEVAAHPVGADPLGWQWLSARADSLPLVLAGPIVRRVEPDSVNVWVATKSASPVRLKVFSGSTLVATSPDTSPEPTTTRIGDNLHVAVVTATPTSPQTTLQPGTLYSYLLTFGKSADDDRKNFAHALGSPLALDQICYQADASHPVDVLPTFALPPTDLTAVQIVHASCRKAHGESTDALPLLDGMLAGARNGVDDAAFATNRPHQLFLTGDQIYADDLAGAWLAMCIDAGGWLMGSRSEPNPQFVGEDPQHRGQGLPWPGDLIWANLASGTTWPTGARTPWPPDKPWPGVGVRGPAAAAAGLTSDAPTQVKIQPIKVSEAVDFDKLAKQTARNHLMMLGEFYAAYLLSWSPVLWSAAAATGGLPSTPPTPWDQGAQSISEFGAGIQAVRRVLANVPTYMICDDHEVTDDWFMNRAWCERVLGVDGDTLGRRIVRNALIAYAVFQAWGNTPTQFTAGTSGASLLALLQNGGEMRIGGDATTVGKLVGMPAPLAPRQRRLQRDPTALTWHYRWGVPPRPGKPPEWPYEVIVLDCRTARRYGDADVEPPQLLDDGVPDKNEAPGMRSDEFTAQLGAEPAPAGVVSLVVAQTPVLGLRAIERLQDTRDVFVSFDRDAESWGLSPNGYQLMLSRLAAHNPTSVLLSGDVHYGFVAAADYWADHPWGENAPLSNPRIARIVQLNSSALKNEVLQTRALTSGGGAALQGHPAVNDPQTWVGFGTARKLYPARCPERWSMANYPVDRLSRPPVVVDFSDYYQCFINYGGGGAPLPTPDWTYRIGFVTGTKQPPTANAPVSKVDMYPPDAALWLRMFGTLIDGVAAVARNSDGTVIVGVNNLSTVTFIGATADVRQVRQVIAWRWGTISHLNTPYATTTYDVPLQTGPRPVPPGS